MELKLDLTPKKSSIKSSRRMSKGTTRRSRCLLGPHHPRLLAMSQYQKQSSAYAEGLESKIATLQDEKQSSLEDREAAIEAKKKLELENASLEEQARRN
jgi:hypothetical protein